MALGLLGTALLVQYCHRSGREPSLLAFAQRPAAARSATGVVAPPRATLRAVGLGETCTTLGAVQEREGGEARVETPELRLYVPGSSGVEAALRFRYLGTTEQSARLGSGERREQVGLRLFGQDTCNALYVMWRFQPTPRLVVSLKRNPGLTRHPECQNRGYENLRAERTRRLAPIDVGSVHELRARLRGSRLELAIDGVVAWEGALDTRALPASGTAGVRSDNVRFDLLSLSAEMRSEAADAARCEGAWVEDSEEPAPP